MVMQLIKQRNYRSCVKKLSSNSFPRGSSTKSYISSKSPIKYQYQFVQRCKNWYDVYFPHTMTTPFFAVLFKNIQMANLISNNGILL